MKFQIEGLVMIMKTALFSVLLILVQLNLHSQGFIEKALNSDVVIQPEITKFDYNRVGTVDFRGDLNVNIPLLTLPGRGGLDIPITINYKSGIKNTEQASWVGLGWSLDFGSITRIVNCLPDFDSTRNGGVMRRLYYNPTITRIPENSDFYMVSLPGLGSSMMYPMESDPNSIFGCSKPNFVFSEWKKVKVKYYVSNYNSQRYYFGKSSGCCSDDDCNYLYDQFGSLSSQDMFLASDPNAWHRCHDTYSLRRDHFFEGAYLDISKFEIITENGTTYVFGNYLKSDHIIPYSPGRGINLVTEYISNWRLTEIRSPDYVDVNNNGPDDYDKGNWVKIEYRYSVNGDNKDKRSTRWLFSTPGAVAETRKHTLLNEMTYLYKISTPTHELEFITSDRDDISYKAANANMFSDGTFLYGTLGDFTDGIKTVLKPKKLNEIHLYKKSEQNRIFIKKILFNYAEPGSNNELCRYIYVPGTGSPSTIDYGTAGSVNLVNYGKTTLKGIEFYDSTNNVINDYNFAYTSEIDQFNPPYYGDGTIVMDHSVIGPQQALIWTNQFQAYLETADVYRTRSNRMGYYFAKANEILNKNPSIELTKGAAAWSLRIIQYPTGAIDTIHYESDSHDKTTDKNNSIIGLSGAFNSMWNNYQSDECGIRVKKISSFEPKTNSKIRESYEYTGGHLPGLPIVYLRNYMYPTDHLSCGKELMTIFDWSTNEVEYQCITKNSENDNSSIITEYNSVNDNDYGYNHYNEQIIYTFEDENGSLWNLLSNDKSWLRGKVKSVTHKNSSNQIIQKERNYYSFNLKGTNKRNFVFDFQTYAMGGESRQVNLTDKVTTYYDQNGSNPINSNLAYWYNSNGVVNKTQEVNSDGTSRITWQSYMSESSTDPLAPMFYHKNILNAVDSIRVYSNDTLRSFTKYFYQNYAASGDTQLYLLSKKEWRDDNKNYQVDADEMINTFTVTSYDAYGNPLKIVDANGVETKLEWNSSFNYSRLTRQTRNGLSKIFDYDNFLNVKTITDENNQTTQYEYDAFGRLIRIKGPKDEVIKEIEYNYHSN